MYRALCHDFVVEDKTIKVILNLVGDVVTMHKSFYLSHFSLLSQFELYIKIFFFIAERIEDTLASAQESIFVVLCDKIKFAIVGFER